MTEMLKTSETTEKLLKFIDASPSCFHAVKNICVMLEDAGCIRLLENETWTLEKGKRYFTTRNGSSVLAFSVPENYNGMQIVSAHSDSPTFRVKSGAEITVEGHYKKLNTEGYGGMILSTWFDRPLSLAGRAVVRTESGVKSVLLNIDRDLCIIPSLAIHMTRGMADHKLNPQVDLLPLLGGENADYNALIAEEAGVKKEDVISSDMFLYPRQHGVVFGMENEFIASPRLDDLQCAFSATEAFLNAENKEKLLISAVFDNEEVGSLTKQGADSTFLTDTVRRIASALNIPEAEWLRKMPDSFMLSADNAHAVHPNYTEKCDQTNRCYLNGGIVIKYSANQKYTTDSVSAAVFGEICRKAEVPVMIFQLGFLTPLFYVLSDLVGSGVRPTVSGVLRRVFTNPMVIAAVLGVVGLEDHGGLQGHRGGGDLKSGDLGGGARGHGAVCVCGGGVVGGGRQAVDDLEVEGEAQALGVAQRGGQQPGGAGLRVGAAGLGPPSRRRDGGVADRMHGRCAHVAMVARPRMRRTRGKEVACPGTIS